MEEERGKRRRRKKKGQTHEEPGKKEKKDEREGDYRVARKKPKENANKHIVYLHCKYTP